jgi:hypothetical protein
MGEILRDLMQDLGRLVRNEIQLARTEFTEKVQRGRTAGGAFATAVLAGFLATACLVTACIAALALVVPLWLAALVMGILLGVIAGGAFIAGRHQWENMDFAPRQTIETLREDVAWAKQQTH